jgi:hypothetical protein
VCRGEAWYTRALLEIMITDTGMHILVTLMGSSIKLYFSQQNIIFFFSYWCRLLRNRTKNLTGADFGD